MAGFCWQAERPEALWEVRCGIPGIDAGEIDVLPAERGDMFEQGIGDISSALAQMGDRTAEIDGIPVDDCADDEIETGCPEGLALEGSIADFPALVEEDRTLELMRRFPLVEAGLTAPPQGRAGIPFDHEQGSLDPAEFPQGPCELARVR